MEVGSGHIELAGVVKTFDGFVNAVDGLNLKIPNGAYCCLLGPSGCGKTTILRMIAGHDDPTAGEILIGGDNVVGLPPVARRTAMMFQSYALFPHLNVRDNIAFALQVRGIAKAERRKAADAMMGKVRLTEFADRLPAQLSGGQQQRVALARGRASSCSTNRFPRSTSSCASRCARSCAICSASSVLPSCTSPTPSSKRSRSPTSWW
jgi:putative spermidine/putrescine transport system ATP-binding protein